MHVRSGLGMGAGVVCVCVCVYMCVVHSILCWGCLKESSLTGSECELWFECLPLIEPNIIELVSTVLYV